MHTEFVLQNFLRFYARIKIGDMGHVYTSVKKVDRNNLHFSQKAGIRVDLLGRKKGNIGPVLH